MKKRKLPGGEPSFIIVQFYCNFTTLVLLFSRTAYKTCGIMLFRPVKLPLTIFFPPVPFPILCFEQKKVGKLGFDSRNARISPLLLCCYTLDAPLTLELSRSSVILWRNRAAMRITKFNERMYRHI